MRKGCEGKKKRGYEFLGLGFPKQRSFRLGKRSKTV